FMPLPKRFFSDIQEALLEAAKWIILKQTQCELHLPASRVISNSRFGHARGIQSHVVSTSLLSEPARLRSGVESTATRKVGIDSTNRMIIVTNRKAPAPQGLDFQLIQLPS